MAYSKPIIASNLLVIKEILRDGENALLCDPEDVESWQAAILGLKDSMPLRRKLGTQAFKDLQDKYTWIKRARNVICGINCEQGKF
jgi:glycosyltransferase involved in cell wall biosynthesis